MFSLLFALIGLVAVTSGSNDKCGTNIFDTCRAEQFSTLSFPKTEEEVDKFCDIFLPYLECMKDYSDSCELGVDFNPTIDKTQEVIIEICRKDSYLHAAIVENIGCLNDVKSTHIEMCSNETESETQKFKAYLTKSDLYDDDDHEYFAWPCFRETYEISCFAANVLKSCGPISKNAVLEVIHRSELVRGFCHEESLRALTSYLKTLDMKQPENAIMEKLLRHNHQNIFLSFDIY